MWQRGVLCGLVFVVCLTGAVGPPAQRVASVVVDTGDVDDISLRGLSSRSTTALRNGSLALLGNPPPVTAMIVYPDIDNVGHCPMHQRVTKWYYGNLDFSEVELEIVGAQKLPDYTSQKWWQYWNEGNWKPHPFVRLAMDIDGRQVNIQTPHVKSVDPREGVTWKYTCTTSVSWTAKDIMIHGEVKSKKLSDDTPAIRMGGFSGHMSLQEEDQTKKFEIDLDVAMGDGGRVKFEKKMFYVEIRAVAKRGPYYIVPIVASCVCIIILVVFFLFLTRSFVAETDATDTRNTEMTQVQDDQQSPECEAHRDDFGLSAGNAAEEISHDVELDAGWPSKLRTSTVVADGRTHELHRHF